MDDETQTHAENEASTLDQATHNEMLVLYEETANSIRFRKRMQWITLGGTFPSSSPFSLSVSLSRHGDLLSVS